MVMLLLKSHVAAYTKGDGTYVPPHDTKVQAKGKQFALFRKKPSAGIVGAQYGGSTVSAVPVVTSSAARFPNAILHPQPHDDGGSFQINAPNVASSPITWGNPDAIATFIPGGPVPAELNGVAMAPWDDAPTGPVGWAYVAGQHSNLDEPPLPEATTYAGKPKDQAAGAIIEEPDGRVWVMRPTNGFGGYDATFPKGRADDGLPLQAVAIKEAFEETGMQIEITGYWGDIERTQTVARYYRARRVGGTPAAMGWEAQAVQLVPKDELLDVLNSPIDHKIIGMANN